MPRKHPHLLSALGLALALGSCPLVAATPSPRLDKAAMAQQRSLQPARMMQAQSYLQNLRTDLGLGAKEAFVARNAFTNEQGETLVHLDQTFDGRRVWGAQALVKVGSEGILQTQTQSVRTGIAVQGAPQISAEFAQKIVLAHLAPKGVMNEAPVVEQVVFPATFTGGLAMEVDPVTGRKVLDRKNTIIARPAAPYVWAYEVRTRLDNPEDGLKSLSYLVDGNTGKILRINDLILKFAPTPAQGTGKGFYRGDVSLDTAKMLDGSYALIDPMRGSRVSPYVRWYQPNPTTGWSNAITGNQIFYRGSTPSGGWNYSDALFQGNTTNTWGDGKTFTDWGNSGGTNGQSAGVDASSAVATTWDFWGNVFGRDGLDGNGTSVIALVLDPYQSRWSNRRDSSTWDIGGHAATFGVGSYPTNPNGLQSLADLDVVAHEMTHGLTSPGYFQMLGTRMGTEEAAISEAISDFFGQMVKTWAARDASAWPDTIPATGPAWEIGKGPGHGTPMRHLIKPSLDAVGYDGWFQGIGALDPHHASGPINRALYFLAQGSSSNAADLNFSPFQPEGMKGVGNDIAARIVYKAITEYMIGDGTSAWTFDDFRAACIMAAGHLPWYIQVPGSVDAVKNAFAAANIGDASGKAARTKVLFTPWRNGDFIETANTYIDYSATQILPTNETVMPRVTVLNNANTAVTWSVGGPSTFDANYTPNWTAGGRINADGTWTTPNVIGWASITATSKADPNQFAEGAAFLANLDTDMDLEFDALDMGPVALSWGLSTCLNLATSINMSTRVDDLDVSFFVDAAKSTWPNK